MRYKLRKKRDGMDSALTGGRRPLTLCGRNPEKPRVTDHLIFMLELLNSFLLCISSLGRPERKRAEGYTGQMSAKI